MRTYFYSIAYPAYSGGDKETVSGLIHAANACEAFNKVRMESTGELVERMYGPVQGGPPTGRITAFNYVEDVN